MKKSNTSQPQPTPNTTEPNFNKINWLKWSPQTLDKATSENKPIFLSIGYNTNYWCHKMSTESFSNADVALFMNSNFINISVDKEEHPELSFYYMKASQIISNQSGWPLNCFLTPSGAPFYAGTYLPFEDQDQRPGLLRMARAINKLWGESPEKLIDDGTKLCQLIADEFSSTNSDRISPGLLEETVEQLESRFDSSFGGFERSQKFPSPHHLLFLLQRYNHRPDSFSKQMILTTLSNALQKGLHDHIDGGFFRYTKDHRWFQPSFEKNLCDNSLQLLAMTQAQQVFPTENFSDSIHSTFSFLQNQFHPNQAGYISSISENHTYGEGNHFLFSLA